jgi:hypothetical protein
MRIDARTKSARSRLGPFDSHIEACAVYDGLPLSCGLVPRVLTHREATQGSGDLQRRFVTAYVELLDPQRNGKFRWR